MAGRNGTARIHGYAGARKRMRMSGIALACILLALNACALPRWPVEGPITSPFGLRFFGLRPDLHSGVDIAAPEGTPVHAMKAGRVTFAGTMSGYGLAVIIEHGRDFRTLYGHLSRIAVATGDVVERDAVIGQVGATGNATAPHLHFEVRRWGTWHDPVPLLGGRPKR